MYQCAHPLGRVGIAQTSLYFHQDGVVHFVHRDNDCVAPSALGVKLRRMQLCSCLFVERVMSALWPRITWETEQKQKAPVTPGSGGQIQPQLGEIESFCHPLNSIPINGGDRFPAAGAGATCTSAKRILNFTAVYIKSRVGEEGVGISE